ncbi:caspase family protein [Micromonospora rubida]|uniref:caspase family protein n=1 Tax=Micromonospora rubida TaxID=2697657 RepID=UPI00137905C4|nr:caspase family protein [Micromonospora rubida]NBE84918.1 caspase family protein [Micromonospora rubida]
MSTLYALLVGIDRYRSPAVPDLRGCRTDIDDALAYLQTRTAPGVDLDALVLSDGQATREAVIGALRSHLGRARSGDTALFWFSGHGSQASAPQWWYAEPSHLVQTLVCADSRHGGVPDLLDKELSILLDEVARRAGHVAVVLDSCHSAGATRELEDREPGARARAVEPMPAPPARELLLPELAVDERPSPPAPDHVVLAASRSHEAAQEMDLGGRRRGLFSWALLRALGRLGPTATYRDLLIAAQVEVEQNAYQQVPQLVPPGRGIADRPFLGGRLAPPQSGLVLRYARDGWEVNAGSCHGLLPPPDATAGAVRVAVVGGSPVREAEVVQVLAERSLVEPVRWRPEPDRQYRVVLSRVPLPATTVAVGGADQDRATAAAVLAALGTAGPDGGPSAYLRPVDPAGTDTVPELRVRTPRPGVARVEDRQGVRLTGDLTVVVGGGARRAVRELEHIARWRQLRDLTNPVTGLAGAVAVEVVAARPGETIAPLTRAPVEADADGVVRLRYEPGPAGWVPPKFFVRLHNRSDRRLFCVLLDLTERFRVHADLFPGDHVVPGGRTAALRGRRVVASLPAGSVPEPGRRARDWLKLVVAEEQFSPEPFEMPALGDPRGGSRGPFAVRGFLDRVGRAVQHRDLVASAEDGAYDWATVTVPLVIEVPGPGN